MLRTQLHAIKTKIFDSSHRPSSQFRQVTRVVRTGTLIIAHVPPCAQTHAVRSCYHALHIRKAVQVDARIAILVIPGQGAASSIVTLAGAGVAAALVVVVAVVRLPAGYHRPIPTYLRCEDEKMSAEKTARLRSLARAAGSSRHSNATTRRPSKSHCSSANGHRGRHRYNRGPSGWWVLRRRDISSPSDPSSLPLCPG